MLLNGSNVHSIRSNPWKCSFAFSNKCHNKKDPRFIESASPADFGLSPKCEIDPNIKESQLDM